MAKDSQGKYDMLFSLSSQIHGLDRSSLSKVLYGSRLAALLKQVFSCEPCNFFQNSYLYNISSQLLLSKNQKEKCLEKISYLSENR